MCDSLCICSISQTSQRNVFLHRTAAIVIDPMPDRQCDDVKISSHDWKSTAAAASESASAVRNPRKLLETN